MPRVFPSLNLWGEEVERPGDRKRSYLRSINPLGKMHTKEEKSKTQGRKNGLTKKKSTDGCTPSADWLLFPLLRIYPPSRRGEKRKKGVVNRLDQLPEKKRDPNPQKKKQLPAVRKEELKSP